MMQPRPADAPAGMIRAQLATFPAREPMLREVVQALLPQVDRLVILFNGYAEAPADLADHPAIEAITTDLDTKDTGKFFSPPAPDDIVFLLEDDIGYPPDYVERSIAEASRIGWDGNVFGYLGFVHHEGGDDQPQGWEMLPFNGRLTKARGVRMLGTGTALARGDAIPPMGFMLNYIGHGDVGFALHGLRRGRLAWALPRQSGWLKDRIARDQRDPALFAAERQSPGLAVVAGLRELIDAPMGHVDVPYEKYARTGAAAAGRARGA
ncbi:hypothetical protein [Paracoccus contaminans]|uniref:Glycosyl transferase n=1 Tax=Paracoccus contaminans TaxID=1945662 RepID=A0A1W6CYA8_9RHOB|nr:hypothetical protein [Paracoccus contaminans]ARJ69838.1 hypothetical protein B0A89_09590 [Paracoccus contaminans]